MARTQSELVERTLQKIGVLEANEPIDASDDALVDKIYTDLLEDLRDEGLVYWDANAIPNVVFLAMVEVLGSKIMPEFGINDIQIQAAYEASGTRRLRKHIAKKRSSEPVRSQYF